MALLCEWKNECERVMVCGFCLSNTPKTCYNNTFIIVMQ